MDLPFDFWAPVTRKGETAEILDRFDFADVSVEKWFGGVLGTHEASAEICSPLRDTGPPVAAGVAK